jgi:membrane peptidoglycan carboxypeptidase
LFVGYTPNLAGAVWAGNPENYQYKMNGVRIGGRYYDEVCGGCLPGPIWRDAMNRALRDVPAENFERSSSSFALPGEFPGQSLNPVAAVPSMRGRSLNEAVQALTQNGLPFEVRATPGSDQPPGTVAFTSPGDGEPVPPGGRVTVFVSSSQGRSATGESEREGEAESEQPGLGGVAVER